MMKLIAAVKIFHRGYLIFCAVENNSADKIFPYELSVLWGAVAAVIVMTTTSSGGLRLAL